MNRLDKLIGYISPTALVKRQQARFISSQIEKLTQRDYDAGGRGRRTKNWKAGGTSANQEVRTALKLIRNRSRDLIRNNSYAKHAVYDVIPNNVIGTGIRPQPWADGAKEKRIKKVWQDWAETRNCDWYGQKDIYGLQREIMRAVGESGECIVRIRMDSKNPSGIPFRLQVIESDYIDDTKDLFKFGKAEQSMEMGFKLDDGGRKVGVWLYDSHPGEGYGTLESRLIPIDNAIHVYEALRPGQVRGVPFGVSSFIRIKDFDEYEDAQLVRQKIASMFAAFIHDSSGGLDPVNTNTNKYDYQGERLEPGLIQYLNPGEQIQLANPPAVEGYGDYTRGVLRGIAGAYGITYEALTNDYSNVNFSSGRMGWIEMQRNVHNWQHDIMISMFLNPIWEKFINLGIIAGTLLPSDNVRANWTPPRREMIDPEKEIKGMATAVRNGLNSYSDTVRQLGRDADDVIEELRDDFAKFDAANLTLDIDPRKITATGKAVAPSNTNENNGDSGTTD